MAQRRISVSQLRCACVDPAWRAAWRRGATPSTRPAAGAANDSVHGTLFHKLTEDFTGWLTDGRSATNAARVDHATALWHTLYERFAAAPLAALAAADQVESAHHLARCLRAFCDRLEHLRRRTPDFSTWQNLFLGREYQLNHLPLPAGSTRMWVSGRLDAVRVHPEHGIEVVDYKLSQGAHAKHDLIQLAIYSRLLSAAKRGLRCVGTLEYYSPELQALQVTAEELDGIFDDSVQPVLDELSGTRAPPRRIVDPPPPEKPAQKPAREPAAAPDRSHAIRDCFASFKLEVEPLSRHEAPQLVRYHLRPAPGVKVVSLANRAQDLQVSLALKQPPIIEPAQGYVTIDIPKERPDTVLWRDTMDQAEDTLQAGALAFPIGMGVDGKPLVADFADPNTCHALVAGASGSGKSEFLKSVAASLVARQAPDRVKLSFIDPKMLTFSAMQRLDHLAGPVITDLDVAVRHLERAVTDMDNRYRRLEKEGYVNLAQRLTDGHHDIPFHVIVVDEFADLILAGRKQKQTFENLVSRLAGKGRAAGIHLVLATQRPDRNIVTGPIKANLPLKVCLRVTSTTNSQIVLDQTGGEALLGRGDLLCDRGRGIERAQSPFVTAEDIERLQARPTQRERSTA